MCINTKITSTSSFVFGWISTTCPLRVFFVMQKIWAVICMYSQCIDTNITHTAIYLFNVMTSTPYCLPVSLVPKKIKRQYMYINVYRYMAIHVYTCA